MTKPDFGDGKFEFGRWETPFENTSVDVIDLAWGPGHSGRWSFGHRSRARTRRPKRMTRSIE